MALFHRSQTCDSKRFQETTTTPFRDPFLSHFFSEDHIHDHNIRDGPSVCGTFGHGYVATIRDGHQQTGHLHGLGTGGTGGTVISQSPVPVVVGYGHPDSRQRPETIKRLT